jgi:hypothetical protein
MQMEKDKQEIDVGLVSEGWQYYPVDLTVPQEELRVMEVILRKMREEYVC